MTSQKAALSSRPGAKVQLCRGSHHGLDECKPQPPLPLPSPPFPPEAVWGPREKRRLCFMDSFSLFNVFHLLESR